MVDLARDRLVLKAIVAGPPAVGKSERLWQLGNIASPCRVLEFGRTPLGPQRMANLDLDVTREGRPVEIEFYEWHGPERADVRGKGLFAGLDGFIYIADARSDRRIDTIRQLEHLIDTVGRTKISRIPSVLLLGQIDEGDLVLSSIEPQLVSIAWGQKLECPLTDTSSFIEAIYLLGESMLARIV